MKSGYEQFFKNARRAQSKLEPMPAVKPQAKQVTRASSKELAEKLRQRLGQNQKMKRKAKPVPWKLMLTSFVGVTLTLFGFLNLDKMESIFKNVEVSLLGVAVAEETKPVDTKAAAAKEPKVEDKQVTVKKEFSSDEINHFSKLNEKSKELDAREAELNRLESELQIQKEDLGKRLVELEQIRKNISQVLDEKVQADDKKVETLVQVYSTMKPQQAAKVFETMDEDLAVEILGRMKKKNAAEIMNLIKAEKAQGFSEKFAGYKRK